MEIRIIPHSISKELQQELDVYNADDFHRKRELESISTIDELYDLFDRTKHFQEIRQILGKPTFQKQNKLKIIEIGAGAGLASLFLPTQGYRVTAVEPSLACCNIL